MKDSSPPAPGDGHPAESPTDDWPARYRSWLTLLVRMQMGSGLRGKCDPSDIVQQSLMEAWRSAAAFRGSTEAERTAWLRQIVAHVLAHEIRRYHGTRKRDVGRELSIEKSLARSSQKLDAVLASRLTSPSQQVAKREQLVHLADTLEKLPADYREVILLRNVEGLSHAEVAERMGRQEGAVRMLWVRALKSLREQFGAKPGDSLPS